MPDSNKDSRTNESLGPKPILTDSHETQHGDHANDKDSKREETNTVIEIAILNEKMRKLMEIVDDQNTVINKLRENEVTKSGEIYEEEDRTWEEINEITDNQVELLPKRWYKNFNGKYSKEE
ncbi:hypothetical protein SNEBB_010923, partial [Seison nebaliae]